MQRKRSNSCWCWLSWGARSLKRTGEKSKEESRGLPWLRFWYCCWSSKATRWPVETRGGGRALSWARLIIVGEERDAAGGGRSERRSMKFPCAGLAIGMDAASLPRFRGFPLAAPKQSLSRLRNNEREIFKEKGRGKPGSNQPPLGENTAGWSRNRVGAWENSPISLSRLLPQ